MRGTEWAPLYLLVVLAIAAILLVTFVKPRFRQAAVTADDNSKAAKAAAQSALPFLAFWGVGQKRKNKNTPIQLALTALGMFFQQKPVPIPAVEIGGRK